MIFNPDLAKRTDDDTVSGDYFGWEEFTLVSKERKAEYTLAQIFPVIKEYVGAKIALMLLERMGYEVEDFESIKGVDHNSQISFPLQYDGKMVDMEFLQEYKALAEREGILILGGNDNDGYHTLSKDPNNSRVELPRFYGEHIICRRDGNFWVLFDKNSGNRLIFSFRDENVEKFVAESPLLVDLKITDYCDKGCSYCYQDSTVQGKHADYAEIAELLDKLSTLKVFEVALGGGEPASHPNFIDILKYSKRVGIVPNFTTRNYKILDDKDSLKNLLNLIGGVALSVATLDELSYLIDKRKELIGIHYDDLSKIGVQIIPALWTKENFKKLLITCRQNNIRVTLLGLKSSGRGKTTKALRGNAETTWVSVATKLAREDRKSGEGCPRLSIDTQLAAKYGKELEESGLPSWLYHIEEGKYNMYIDAVDKKYGPSSYHEKELKSFSNCFSVDLLDLFKSLPIVKGDIV
jgi:organic radical activating enzyme